MLQGEHLTLTYQDGETTLDAVHDVSITVEDHQFVGLSLIHISEPTRPY